MSATDSQALEQLSIVQMAQKSTDDIKFFVADVIHRVDGLEKHQF